MSTARAQRLDKVLALVDSDMEGEALTALRKARQMLAKEGLSFEDLARVATGSASAISLKTPFGILRSAQQSELEIQLEEARATTEDMRLSLHEQDQNLRQWQRKAMELERKLDATASEAKKWQELARETAERLWDLGTSIERGEAAALSAPAPLCALPSPSKGKQHRRKTKVKKPRRRKK
ncbi:MAG: hypothetical protein ABTQ34_03600 [Bdellovibrionales bacterium]